MGGGATREEEDQSSSSPLLLHHHPDQPSYGIPIQNLPPNYILLPTYPRRRRRNPCIHCCSSLLTSSSLLTLSFTLLLFLTTLFFLFPSSPSLHVVRLHLNSVHVSSLSSLSISLALKLRIRNPDFFSFHYDSVVVSIYYRGRRLGVVTTTGGGGHVRARGVSYVDAEMELDGVQIIHDVFHLIEDVAKGEVPFETVTQVDGRLKLFFLDVPVNGKISCEVSVNPENQTVVNQNCYPE